MAVRYLGPEEWRTFRDVRLAALKEAPYAFGSTYAREANLPEKHWRGAVIQRTRFVAEIAGEVAGTVAAGPGELSSSAALTALWVDPRHRERGVGSALVDAVVDWAAARGFSQILLWVTDVNLNAERLYAHHGFARTGRANEVRPGEPAVEYEMAKPIQPATVPRLMGEFRSDHGAAGDSRHVPGLRQRGRRSRR
jgi:GNAT superfamily N-acetyltransferase